ncbi:segregation and condensation protein A [Sphingomonas sp.]|uniref:segregation and condensation protein A n=1 Tax=Sphingomonas sp. TaxID=28214 RepID=UPI0035BBFB66
MDDALALDLDGWEGPLDLLLALARSQKVDLRQISILALVEQYLAVIERAQALRLEIAADWLVMAAWLAYLKSALLLPREPVEEPDAEIVALHLQLRLERLAAMRDAGARLMACDRLGRDVFLRDAPEGLRTTRHSAWQAEYLDLVAAYGRVAARTRPVLHVIAHRAVMTLEDAMARLSESIGTTASWETIEALLPLSAGPALRRSALASTFLAALELARQGRVALRQEAAFAPLYLRQAS